MAKRIVQMHDKYKSTTNLYPKVTMGSLSPQVKAYIESQGGEFPSLEITAEQQQSEGIYLLTDEQIATMEDATFMYIKVPTLTKPILFFRGVDQLFDGVYLVGVTVVSNSNYSNIFIRYGLSVNKSNNLASLRDGSFGRYEITSMTASNGVISSVSIKDYLTKNTSVLTGGKQLYQHNIALQGQCMINGYDKYFRGFIVVINDSNLPFVKSNDYVEGTNLDIQNWLYQKGWYGTSLNNSYPCNLASTDKTYFANGIGADNSNYFHIFDIGETSFQLSNTTVNDTVIAL